MKKELEKKLVKKYPNLYKNYFIPKSSMSWGFSCGDGWYEVIDWLSGVLEAIGGVVADQVKEKFGSLRFYYSFPNGTSGQIADAVRNIITEAVNRTYKTCENCGKPGGPRLNKVRQTKVLCNECYKVWKEII